MYIEMPVPSVIDPNTADHTELKVECLDTGIYNIPPIQGDEWPNCTATVRCGDPPSKPINNRINGTDGHDGSITWLNNNNQDVYNTSVKYKCADGSQFDTSDNSAGDTVSLVKRCRWDKTWTPDTTLPACFVTYCIHRYPIPADTFLREITSAWTGVGQRKQYECQGRRGNRHTRFWESDRSKSTFDMLCLPDGTYSFDNLRESWPTCIEDVLCDSLPPEVPTHTEYTLPAYDGSVKVTSMTDWPSLIRSQNMYNSTTTNSTSLARNYMTNLTYTCGSARRFMTSEGPMEEQAMTCTWDRVWEPSEDLETCNWVACLKPPTPPLSTHLRVTDWDGQPIEFGGDVHFVCDRGLMFEDDSAQEEQTYSCQDGTVKGTKRGFFDVPEDEEDWPRCLRGI